MPNRDVVAIGTSAGGVEALLHLAKSLPPNLAAAVLVTIHLPSFGASHLDGILSRAGKLPASFAQDGEPLRKGRLLLAPPGHHLVIEANRLWLSTGPRENGARPAIDPMFRSAAVCCGHRTIGVVMTGAQGDGASGLWAIAQSGGITVVQDPKDAAFAQMPRSALDRFEPDHIASLSELPALLSRLVEEPAGKPVPASPTLRMEVDIARGRRSSMSEMDRIGRRSVLTCPDCNGVMWEINEGELTHYRCHVGHAYSEEALGFGMDENLRRALATALRTLEERSALTEKLRAEALARGQNHAAMSWAESKREFEEQAESIRQAIRRTAETASLTDNPVEAE